MLATLKDPILTVPPLGESEPPEAPSSYVNSRGATVLNAAELAEARSAIVPPTPRLNTFGERISHITHRFVLTGSRDAYRIWRFQSAAPAIEFPVTEEGWALAWTTFRGMENQAA